ncbi:MULTISPECIES: protein kinase domain-containing protein [Streptomyces]|uniref:protein kinase domain-containing protein n=1 Tax=Streptomyces TaxID=1883 RepID=UPI00069A69DF|nr:protein kinase [Streptomyces sp. SID7805]MYU56875.1 protein kinase [Streptomyces sp. SID7805]
MSGQGPYDLPTHVQSAVTPLSKRLVVNRRGSTVWDVQSRAGRFAVKLGYPTQAHGWTAWAPAREAVILRQLIPDEVQFGEWEEGTWSAQPWRDGESLYNLWEPHRQAAEPSTPNLDEARSCAVALTHLHEGGWVHGDVQPNHFVIGPTGTFLIDLALAQGGEVPKIYDFRYRGCLVHYEAPEISRSILESGTAVPTKEADVYALGASWFISATGWRHVSYPDDADRKDQRQAIVDKPHRPINVPGTLGKIIEQMMSRDPADRPTGAEICEELGHAR